LRAGLGSRGILYAPLLAAEVAAAVTTADVTALCPEVRRLPLVASPSGGGTGGERR